MWQLLVTVTICAQSIPLDRCNPHNGEARAVLAFVAPEGVLMCGLPTSLEAAATAPRVDEYAKTRCELKKAAL